LVVGWLLLCIIAAALIAPWLFLGVQELAAHFHWLDWLAGKKLHRYFNRLVMIFAILGIFPLGRILGYRTRESLGLGGTHRRGRAWVGFLASALCLGLLAAGIGLAGVTELDPKLDAGGVAKVFLGATLVALLVAFVEEIFFRGFLYDIARKDMGTMAGAILISFFYSLVHFIKSPGGYHIDQVRWDSVFGLMPKYFSGVQHLDSFLFGFLNLFVVGWMLAWAYERTGSLYLSIGLHAGWVWALKMNGGLTEWSTRRAADLQWLLGYGGDMVSSSLALVILLMQWWLLRRLSRQLIVLGP
jgi:membrane protease YdiL (CAAX protease family)